MKKHYILLLILILSFSATCQNTFFIGSSSYTCTDSFTLHTPETVGGKELDISIAKTEQGGLLILNYRTFSSEKIMGKVRILLDDKTFITCIDRGIADYVNSIYTKVYKLTESEINRLKSNNIYSLRFTLVQDNGMFQTKEDYSVVNDPSSTESFFRQYVDVPALLNEIY